jgi:hypothetical protein
MLAYSAHDSHFLLHIAKEMIKENIENKDLVLEVSERINKLG